MAAAGVRVGVFGAAEARTNPALGPLGLVSWGRLRSAAEFSGPKVLQMGNYEICLVFMIKEVSSSRVTKWNWFFLFAALRGLASLFREAERCFVQIGE